MNEQEAGVLPKSGLSLAHLSTHSGFNNAVGSETLLENKMLVAWLGAVSTSSELPLPPPK